MNGAAKYRVMRKDAKSNWKTLANVTETSYVDTTAVSGVKYQYTVRCVTADGKLYTSGYNTKGLAITYIAAPKFSSITNGNAGSELVWKPVKGAKWYRVYVKNGRSWKQIGETRSTTFTVKNRKSGTKYIYTIRALNADKKYIGGYNTSGWASTFIAAPGLPKVVNTKKGVQVTYSKPKGATWVRVMRRTAKGKWVKVTDTKATKIIDTTAKKGVKYFYTVRVLSADREKFISGYNTTGRAITR